MVEQITDNTPYLPDIVSYYLSTPGSVKIGVREWGSSSLEQTESC